MSTVERPGARAAALLVLDGHSVRRLGTDAGGLCAVLRLHRQDANPLLP